MQVNIPENRIAWSKNLSAWVVWQYADVVNVLNDKRFSANAANFEHQTVQLPLEEDIPASGHELINRIQKPLLWAGEQMRQSVESKCLNLKNMAGFDMQKDLITPSCNKLTLLLTGCEVDAAEAEKLLEYAQTVFLNVSDVERKQAENATVELSKFFMKHINYRRGNPGDDFVSIFAKSNQPVHVLLSPVIQMFVGLSTSLPLLLGNILLCLLENPDKAERYLQSPKSAVSELLRYAGPAQIVYRLALRDVEIGGHQFRRGDRLGLLLSSANRDKDVFIKPDTLDFGRNAVAHLSFGKGIHACLGAPVIRKAIEIIPYSILSCFKDLKVDIANISWGGSQTISGITALPVFNNINNL
jgi:cytochrome P450